MAIHQYYHLCLVLLLLLTLFYYGTVEGGGGISIPLCDSTTQYFDIASMRCSLCADNSDGSGNNLYKIPDTSILDKDGNPLGCKCGPGYIQSPLACSSGVSHLSSSFIILSTYLHHHHLYLHTYRPK